MTIAARRIESDEIHRRVVALFREHVDAVFNVAFRSLWNRADSEDVVQATFVKAFTKLDQLEDHERVRPWLLQIAYREAIAVIRSRRDLPVDPAEMPEAVSLSQGPADAAVCADIAAKISLALSNLDADERMAVVLRDVEELPMREVAEVLGVGHSAAKMRVHRGRQSLRVELTRLEIEP